MSADHPTRTVPDLQSDAEACPITPGSRLMTRSCRNCGTAMEFYASKVRLYCNRACHHQYNKRHGVSLKPRKGELASCPQCGKQTYKQPGHVKLGYVHCSRACAVITQTLAREGKRCAFCDATMHLKPSEHQRKYCSKECASNHGPKRPLDFFHNGRLARKNHHGYVLVYEPDHPKAMRGWIPYHRYLVEKRIGRYLDKTEAVHHKNGVKDDNRDENLELMNADAHSSMHMQEHYRQIKADREELAEYRRRYGPLD